MTQTILLRRSSTASAVPTTGALQLGEVVVNTYDGVMYMMKNNGTASIVKIGPVNAADITTALGAAPVTSVSVTGPLTSSGGATTPTLAITQATTSTSGYLSSTDWNTFNGKQAALGYTPVNSTLLGAANGVATLNASGQLTAAQIPASLLGAMQFQSVWNASTNSPALTSSTGTAGNFYIVSVAGTTNLNGITQWNVGDMAVFDGGVWNKIDGQASEVTSVAGRVGAVTLAYADISGLGTMAQQTASSVAITGGTISGVTFTGNISGTASNVTGTVAVANGGTGVTTSTGTGSVVLSTSPTLVTPALGTPSSVVLTNATGTAAALNIGGNAATATSATTATNIAAGAAGSLPYQTAAGTTGLLAIGSTNQVLTVVGGVPTWQNAAAGFVNPMTAAGDLIYGGTGGSATRLATGTGVLVGGSTPSYTTTPTLTGTNFSGIPYSAMTGTVPTWNQNTTGNAATATSAVSATSATTATNIAGGAAGSLPYQTAAGTTAMLAAGTGVLVGGATPSYTNAPTLTGTNFTAIPNSALTNSSVTIGTTAIALGASSTTLAGLTSVTSTTFVGALTGIASGNLALTGGTLSGSITFTAGTVTGLAAPTNASDAATKAYVDAATSNLITHDECAVATTAALTATYSNGTSGVGATLTNSGTQAALTIDGTALAVGNRVLVKNQATASQNGVYVVTVVGSASVNWVLTRAVDANNSIASSFSTGYFTFVQSGATNGSTGWVLSSIGTGTNDAIVLGTDNVTFTQFSGAGTYLAGTGLSLTGNTFANTGVLSLTGTTNQITASASTGAITLSLPQNINSGAAPTFAGTNFTAIPNAALTNSSITLGSTSLALGSTNTTIAGLTSVTSTTFIGALTGTASGNLALTGGTLTGGLIFYGANSVTAAGTTQATATAIVADYNYITTVAAGSGVILPTPALGREITVVNRGANPLILYPAVGGAIDGAGTNIGVTVPVNATIVISAQSTSQWFTVTPVYAGGTGITITQSNNGTVTFAAAAIPNSSLTNSTITLGSTSMALGSINTTITGLTSVTSTTFVGALTGNASTATTAGNVTGTVAIANGGTGATSASAALTALGAMAVGVTIDGGAY